MSLEKLISQIEEDADKRVEEIIGKARRESEEIIALAREEARKKAKEIRREGKKYIERVREKTLAAARRKVRALKIKSKEEVIQECLERAKQHLKKMKGKEYEKVVSNLMKKGKETLGDCIVIPSRSEDKKIASKLGLKTEGSINASGGIIMKSKDGSKELNYTFDALIDAKKDELRILIAGILFNEGGKE